MTYYRILTALTVASVITPFASAQLTGALTSATQAASANATTAAQSATASAAHSPAATASLDGVAQLAAHANRAQTVAQIRSASAEARDAVFAQVDSSLKASHRALVELRREGRDLSRDARVKFVAAYDQAREREHAVRASLRAARRAVAEKSAAAQAKLADDYSAYADALANVGTAFNGSGSAIASGSATH